MLNGLLVLMGLCVGVLMLGAIILILVSVSNRRNKAFHDKGLSPEARRGLKKLRKTLRGKSREEIRQFLLTPVYHDLPPKRSRTTQKNKN